MISGSGGSPGEGNGNPLQSPHLENPKDREARQAVVHGVTKSWTRRKQLSMHAALCFSSYQCPQRQKWLIFLSYYEVVGGHTNTYTRTKALQKITNHYAGYSVFLHLANTGWYTALAQ